MRRMFGPVALDALKAALDAVPASEGRCPSTFLLCLTRSGCARK